MLSHYVFEQSDCYFNTVTTVRLPKDSDEETFRKNFFLKGQERDAVNFRLFTPVTQIGIKVIPTWRCNLRCTHCFVLHKLQKKDQKLFDVNGFLKLVDALLDKFPLKIFGVTFVGGECTLESEMCCEILDGIEKRIAKYPLDFWSSLTTNGTNWDRPTVELYSKIRRIMVSLDGSAAYHNKQRHAFDESLRGQDLYKLTLRNIKRMALMGFTGKMSIQASLYDEGFQKHIVADFYRDLLSCGIPRPQICIGSAVPTPTNATTKKETELYKTYLARYLFNRPCCTWRFGKELVVDNTNKVYSDYFQDSNESVLGNFDSPVEEILKNHELFVRQKMPVLNDEKCQSCPVLGACWGRCSNTDFLKPSTICNPEALLQLCQEFAKSDKLVSKYIKGTNNVQSDLYTHS